MNAYVIRYEYENDAGRHVGAASVRHDTEQLANFEAYAKVADDTGIKLELLGLVMDDGTIRDLVNGLIAAKSEGVQVATVDSARLNTLERDLRNMRRDIAGVSESVKMLADLIRGGVVQQVAAEITANTPRAKPAARDVDITEYELEPREAEYEPGEDRAPPPVSAKMPIIGKPETQPAVNRRLSAAAREVASPTLSIQGERRSVVQRFNGEEWVAEPMPVVGDTLHNRSDIIPRSR